MTGVLGGLVAAVLWGVSAIAAARSTRELGAPCAMSWVLAVGTLVTVPPALVLGFDGPVTAHAIAWTLVVCVITPISFFLMYAALVHGSVSVVMPIIAVSGAIAAVISVVLGERLGLPAGAGLVVLTVGLLVVLTRPGTADGGSHGLRPLLFAAASATCAGIGLYGVTKTTGWLGVVGVVAVVRAAGFLIVGVPTIAGRRFRRPGRAMPYVLFSGVADTLAFGALVWAEDRDGVAVPAVISSQFAAIAALLGILRLGERPTRLQAAGVLALLTGITIVSAAHV
ncbi:MAG: EamA family transporter [Gaiella sp.]